MITNEILATKMIELRVSKNWKLKQMSQKLNIDYRTLRRYEKTDQPVPADIVSKYTQIFHVTLDYLYYGTEISDTELYQAVKGLSPKQRRAVMAVVESYK